MDIRVFTYVLLAAAVVFYLIPVDNVENNDANKDIALVVFEKPDMYTLTTDKITRRIQADNVVRYKNRDEIYNANIMINDNVFESLKANEVISKNNKLSLKGSVFYKKGDFLSLNTEELYYKLEDKIVYNTLPYKAQYYNNNLNGRNLYLDTTKNYLKTRDVHFEIDLNSNKGK